MKTHTSRKALREAFETIRRGLIEARLPVSAELAAWDGLDGVAKQLNVSNPYEHKFVNGEVLTIRK